MFRFVFAILTLFAFSGAVLAQTADPGAHEHGPGVKGSHGGVVQDLGGYEAELVVKGRNLILYLTDHATGKPAQLDGMKATIFVVQGSNRKATITLIPKDGAFQANASIPSGSDAVVNVQLPGGKSSQARFELGGHKH